MDNKVLIKKLYITVFSTGAIVMIIELVGSRILAPTLGTSIFVWTSLIGIILGALSFGYYIGGKLADKNPTLKKLSLIIIIAGVLVFLTIIIKNDILEFSSIFGVKSGAVFSTIVLFAAPGILLGAVSPYAARLAIKKVESSGNTIGSLYAVSTFGSISGTFAAGFYLIPNFGSENILYIIAISLFVVSILVYTNKKLILKSLTLLLFLLLISFFINISHKQNLIVEKDSQYNRITVYDGKKDKKKIRIMSVGSFLDSAMFLNSEELVFEYTKYYRLDNVFKEKVEKVVMFGGAGYSVPKDFLLRNKNGTIDVVEIDPITTEIAKKYFKLKNDKRLKIYHQDARMFLNRRNKNNAKEKYDVVYNDAFSSTNSIPFHLTTKEAVESIYNILSDDGVYIINTISSLSGNKSLFFRSEYKTIKEKFKNVFVFPISFVEEKNKRYPQNIIIVAVKSEVDINDIIQRNKNKKEISKLLNHYFSENIITDDVDILTDDFAPVDFYISKQL